MNYTSVLNNREIATIIWIFIFAIWFITKGNFRSSIADLLKAFFVKKIIFPTIFMFLYIFLMILVLEKVGFWDRSAIKDTILWIFGVAFVMLMGSVHAADDEHYFKKTVLGSIKLIVVFEFIINFYSFNLMAELIIVPLVSIVALISGFTSVKPEYKQLNVFFGCILGLFGIGLIIITFYEIVIDFQSFATLKNFRDFLLPILFTIAFLPFVYIMALYIKYENLFARIDIVNTDMDLARYAKQEIFTTFHFNLKKLIKFSKDVSMLRFNNKDDVYTLIQKFKNI